MPIFDPAIFDGVVSQLFDVGAVAVPVAVVGDKWIGQAVLKKRLSKPTLEAIKQFLEAEAE